jgi:hypothetical protein
MTNTQLFFETLAHTSINHLTRLLARESLNSTRKRNKFCDNLLSQALQISKVFRLTELQAAGGTFWSI